MTKNNVKIKENITLVDKINAIESIVDAHFKDGRYTPYFADIAKIVAIATYFIDGIELNEDDSLYECVMHDEELLNLVNMFEDNTLSHHTIMEFVMKHVDDKVKYIKQQIIHSNPDLDTIVDAANTIINAIGNFANMNLEFMTKENLELGKTVMQKIANSNVKLTPELLTKIVKDASSFNLDEKTAEILDAKNDEIRALRLRIEQLEQK